MTAPLNALVVIGRLRELGYGCKARVLVLEHVVRHGTAQCCPVLTSQADRDAIEALLPDGWNDHPAWDVPVRLADPDPLSGLARAWEPPAPTPWLRVEQDMADLETRFPY